MNATIPVFQKADGTFTRSFTEAVPGGEVYYVELPGYDVPVDVSMDELLELRELGRWRKGQFGFTAGLKDGEKVKLNGRVKELGRKYFPEVEVEPYPEELEQ